MAKHPSTYTYLLYSTGRMRLTLEVIKKEKRKGSKALIARFSHLPLDRASLFFNLLHNLVSAEIQCLLKFASR